MKRLVVIVLPLLLVPLVALSVLAWSLAGRAEQTLLAAQREQHGDQAAAFELRFEEELARLVDRCRRWAEASVTAPEFPPFPLSEVQWVLVFDDQGRWRYPTAYAVHAVTGHDAVEGQRVAFEQLAEAERQEQSGPSPDLAAERYRALDRASVPAEVRAKALHGLARCMRKAGKADRATGLYRRLVDEFVEVVDETGMNLGVEASGAHLELAVSGGVEQAAVAAWRQNVDLLLGDRCRMSWALKLGHLTNALALVPGGADDPADVRRREDLRREVGRLNTMSRAAATVLARPRPDVPRLHVADEEVLLVETLSLPQLRGYVVAAFSGEWVRDRLLKPLIAEVAARGSGTAFVRDALRRTIVGTAIAEETTSVEIPLSRWGLPWSMGVGFADLSAPLAQGTRRHALLTGSIAVLAVLMAAGVAIGWRSIRREVELSKLKSEFVDNVSHELRTPVTSIKLFSEMLNNGQVREPERQREYYRLLASESDRLGRMVENMLNFSRIVAGRMRLRPEPTDMGEYLTALHRQLEIQARTTGHRVRLHLANDLPTCRIDRDALSRAIANLVSNAAKYSPDEREIVVTARLRDEALSISVRDKGMGIPPTDLPHVFDRFYRVKDAAGEHVQGTGLGLTIVKDTVDRHEGQVRIDSRVGSGTVVELLLPVTGGVGEP